MESVSSLRKGRRRIAALKHVGDERGHLDQFGVEITRVRHAVHIVKQGLLAGNNANALRPFIL